MRTFGKAVEAGGECSQGIMHCGDCHRNVNGNVNVKCEMSSPKCPKCHRNVNRNVTEMPKCPKCRNAEMGTFGKGVEARDEYSQGILHCGDCHRNARNSALW